MGNIFWWTSYLRVLGQASDDMKMDSVMSSRTWSRNSAFAQASVADSILFGFSSHDWRDSMILKEFMFAIGWNYKTRYWLSTPKVLDVNGNCGPPGPRARDIPRECSQWCSDENYFSSSCFGCHDLEPVIFQENVVSDVIESFLLAMSTDGYQ